MTQKRPDFIGHWTDFLEEDNSHYPGSDELLGIGCPVGKKLGLQKIGIHIETLLPGRRTSWPHAESAEEEFAYVLEGTPQVWVDGEVYDLVPGDFVAFPSGTGICHTFINNSDFPARLLVGGERSKAENKIIYSHHTERNLQMKEQNLYWDEAPKRKQGPHDGLPDRLREKNGEAHL